MASARSPERKSDYGRERPQIPRHEDLARFSSARRELTNSAMLRAVPTPRQRVEVLFFDE